MVRTAWIERQLRDGYAVHNHVWIPIDLLAVLAWLDRETAAHYEVIRFANTSPLTNEFVFLLRRVSRTARGNVLRRLWLRTSDPWLGFLALLKRALRA